MDNLCHFHVNHGDSRGGRHRFASLKFADRDFNLTEDICAEALFGGIVGQSSAIPQVLRLIETVAPTDSTVLLLGETGTARNWLRAQSTSAAAVPSGR